MFENVGVSRLAIVMQMLIKFITCSVECNTNTICPFVRCTLQWYINRASESAIGAGAAGAAGATVAGAGAALALAVAAWRAARRRRKPRKPPAPQPEKTAEHDDAEPDLIPNNYSSESAIGAGAAGAAGATVAGAGAALALAVAAWRAARRRRKPRKPPAPQPEKTAEHDDAEPDLIPNNYYSFIGCLCERRVTLADAARRRPMPPDAAHQIPAQIFIAIRTEKCDGVAFDPYKC
ncbi:unnamed protein product [Euphydryas editha]|uniref:Uncharacterized protein n=1 Tax=Euphydryas editha TaxID=104508 RepID=A0AAU9V1K0_EUPED|nr:unnamed protein product [Euphydryas editha]